jgi:hypothetical protein
MSGVVPFHLMFKCLMNCACNLFTLFEKNIFVCKINLNQIRELEKVLLLVAVGCSIVS